MRGLKQLGSEEGATAVLVALLMVPLLGIGALVIDVGFIYYEVRQLQNGADAAALAIAQDCAEGDCGPYDATASSYTNANADDGAAAADVDLPGDDGTNSVTVTASTRTADGGDRLTYRLAGVLEQAFDSDFNGEFERSATAVWGRVGGGTTIPIAICNRAWDHWTTTVGLPSGPPDHYLSFGGAAAAPDATCTNPSYDTYNGGFGFLRRDEDCRAETELDPAGYTWVQGIQGNNPQDPPSTCSVAAMYSLFQRIIDAEEPGVTDSTVLIPIFDAYNNSASQFRLVGYGAFRLSGYEINGGPGEKRYGMANNECGNNTGPPNNASCLKGYFTEFVALDALPADGNSEFGTTVVVLTR